MEKNIGLKKLFGNVDVTFKALKNHGLLFPGVLCFMIVLGITTTLQTPDAAGESTATASAVVTYNLPGNAAYQAQLYPPTKYIDPTLGLDTPEKVIAHFTASSLKTDNIEIVANSLKVTSSAGKYRVSFTTQPGFEAAGQLYAKVHPLLLDANHAGQAMNGIAFCKQTPGCWNPMAGYPVNSNPNDGLAKWHLYLALGMPIVNHRAVTLLHYPPWVALKEADYLHNNTLERWKRLLKSVGLPEQDQSLYYNILDVNPIAAPGSGQAEYNNDYFPIMMASVYFDSDEGGRDYIRSMLETLLNPDTHTSTTYTLPLLVAGSPLYDPQAPGWFRVRYKDQLPQKPVRGLSTGIPQMKVLQAGSVKLNTNSSKKTPYMGANHMIAAGVTGHCTKDPSKIPDQRRYEAEDLVAACFLKQFHLNADTAPATAKENCCQEWFGNATCAGAPTPAMAQKKYICILSQIDVHFNLQTRKPWCTWEQAEKWCEEKSGGTYDGCYHEPIHKNFNKPECAKL